MVLMRILIGLIFISPATAATLRVHVVDPSSAPFPKVLVIIKSLDSGREIVRELTDANGRIRTIELDAGVYRLVATCPYGLCKTAVREFLAAQLTDEMLVTVQLPATDVFGELLGAPRLRVVLKRPNGSLASKVRLLVRDLKARREKWYVSDENGSVVIELIDDPVVLVAIHDGTIFSRQIETGCVAASSGPTCSQLDISKEFVWTLQ